MYNFKGTKYEIKKEKTKTGPRSSQEKEFWIIWAVADWMDIAYDRFTSAF